MPVVTVRQNWGVTSVVYYHDKAGRLRGVPLAWTSLFPEDPVVTFGCGRAALRLDNLLELARLVESLRAAATAADQPQPAPVTTPGGVK